MEKADGTLRTEGRMSDENRLRESNYGNLFKSGECLTLRVHLGYLSYDADCQQVFIPNEEVKSEFVDAMEDAGWEYVINAIQPPAFAV